MTSAPKTLTIAVFRYSNAGLFRAIALAIALMAICVVIAFGLTPLPSAGGATELGASAAALAIALAIIIMMLRLSRRHPVLDVTTEGIRDRRLSPDLVLWMDIARATIKGHGDERVLTLQLHPTARARLRRAPGASNWRNPSISMTGLAGSMDDLSAAILRAAVITILDEPG